jgi:hypothetical protein
MHHRLEAIREATLRSPDIPFGTYCRVADGALPTRWLACAARALVIAAQGGVGDS